MNINKTRKYLLCAAICLYAFDLASTGQSYRFRNYGTGNKLPSDVVYSINQDKYGYLWVGTSEGLSRFDGFDFFTVAFPDSAAGRYPTSSLKDSNGRLWFGFNDGTVFCSDGDKLDKVKLPDSPETSISTLLQDKDGFIWAVAQKKPLFRINSTKTSEIKTVSMNHDPTIFSACFGSGGEILLGTQDNLLICRLAGDSLEVAKTIEGFNYSTVTSIVNLDEKHFLVGTDGNGIFLLNEPGNLFSLSRFPGHPELGSLSVKSIFKDSAKNIWVSTSGQGLVKIQTDQDNSTIVTVRFIGKESGLSGENVNLTFTDSQADLWIGFNGSGLSLLGTAAFEFVTPGTGDYPNNIIFAGRLKDGYLLGTPSGFYLYNLDSGKTISFTPMLKETGRNEISSYCIDRESNLWIGTKGSGLFLRGSDGIISQFYKSGDTGSDYINDIKQDGENLWLATLNGVNIISVRNRSLKIRYNMDNGLPHNSINQVFIAPDGSGYVATESDRLYSINPVNGIKSSQAVMYGTLLNKVLDITESNNGTIWTATQGNGVFEIRGDSVRSISTTGGLLSNYTYSILADRENNIWIGHERGISRYNPSTGFVKVLNNDFAKGGSCNLHAISESPDGKILIGTTEGLIIYDRSKDRKSSLPPVNNINSVTINNVPYPYQSTFNLPYQKQYNIRINFAGIDFTNPEKVYYSTFLTNFDNDWTKPSLAREAIYNLRDGRYKFSLLSINEDGLTQENPLTMEITIASPFWRTWWFIFSMFGVAAGAVALIIREREKALRKREEYLEKELDARTAVVRKQKAEIEIQNLEITDSINYAKRIQSSILPGLDKLKEHFRDAFIMLYPRDIVSGDFYWFEKVEDDRFILVCADSTGHGVPGAFMSMIGSTLLQDIVSRQRIYKPSEILARLDKQVFSTLNQNLEVGVSNDGMDIVVCEFTNNNRHIRFASAMRPVIIVMGGDTYYIKGNRASVGGQSVIEKYFDDQEYYLSEGDAIYMFSDGLPDQFGGPDGKKMKIARLKNLISEISALDIKKQEEELTRFYNEWKGDYDQVDDILFMGVKV